jgi:hypothetical protein
LTDRQDEVTHERTANVQFQRLDHFGSETGRGRGDGMRSGTQTADTLVPVGIGHDCFGEAARIVADANRGGRTAAPDGSRTRRCQDRRLRLRGAASPEERERDPSDTASRAPSRRRRFDTDLQEEHGRIVMNRRDQEVGQERIPETVPDADALLSVAHDVARPHHAEPLRDDRLAETERVLQLVHTLLAGDEDLDDADPARVGQRPEERGIEGLEIIAVAPFDVGVSPDCGTPGVNTRIGDSPIGTARISHARVVTRPVGRPPRHRRRY